MSRSFQNIQHSVSNEPESHITRKNERRPESNPFSTARNSATSQRRGVGDVCNNPADHFFWTDKSEKKKSLFSYLPKVTSKSEGLLIAPVNKLS